MKLLARDLLVCCVVAAVVATGVNLMFAWFATMPRITYVSFGYMCERLNTPTTFFAVFAAVFALTSIIAFLVELRRRLDAWAKITPARDPRANDAR